MRSLAVSLTDAILEKYEAEISSLRLVPSDGGRFEVSLNDHLVFSRLQSGQRAEIPDIMRRIQEERKAL
jgi:selenoprotein W-related protein